MKKLIYILFPILSSVLFYGCEEMFGDFLEKAPSAEVDNPDVVFSNSLYTEYFHNNIYNYQVSGYNRYNDGSFLDAATDLGEMSYQYGVIDNGLNVGNYYGGESWMETVNPYNHYYGGIRVINIFLENIDSANITQDVVKTDPLLWKRQKIAEALYLRAMFYWELVIRYGGVPVVTKSFTLDENLKIPRSSFNECVDFILNDLNIAIQEEIFPMSAGLDYGRACKAAALALKSRILLFRASPLNNPENSINKWNEAMAAASVVLKAPKYKLMDDYQQVFLKENNTEIIYAKNEPKRNWWPAQSPVGYGGEGGLCPTQELVDMYDMADGTQAILGYNPDGSPIINPASGYNDQNPYANREPRFYKSILFNGNLWWNRPIETFFNGFDKPAGNTKATETGYYIKKFMDGNNTDPYDKKNVVTPRNWVYIRLAEIYLNYAEARNEVLSAPDDSVYLYVDMVRMRNGFGITANLPKDLTKEQMRERIRKERAVEFCFEEHRWWDLRRWKIAGEVLNKPIHGMEIIRNVGADTTFTYNRIKVEERIFTPNMYLYPIPEDEIYRNPELQNNPGW